MHARSISSACCLYFQREQDTLVYHKNYPLVPFWENSQGKRGDIVGADSRLFLGIFPPILPKIAVVY